MDSLLASVPYLLRAFVQTLGLSLIAIVAGTLLGVPLGILAAGKGRVIRLILTFYSFVVRGIPILILMFIAYFGFPALGLKLTDFTSVSLALTVYAAAFVLEITRSALLSVPRGQIEAASAIGLRRRHVLWHVMLPQAARSAYGGFVAHSVLMIKSTAYVSVVGVWELSYATRELAERTIDPFPIFIASMVLYFVLCYPLSLAGAKWKASHANAV